MRLLLTFHWESFLGRIEPWTPSISWFNLTVTIQAKISKVLTGNIYFFAMTSSVSLTTYNCKSRAQTTSFSKKSSVLNYLSNEVVVCQLFLLTLIFDRMGRLGQIEPIRIPCKILKLGTEIKKSAGGTF